MNNLIPQNKLIGLAQKTEELITVVNEGIDWVNNFLKQEEKDNTKYEVKKYRRTLKKVQAVVTQKPTVALFGASQVGKSYMANNLLYNTENKLLVYNHQGNDTNSQVSDQQLIDFLVHINPEGGGKEATATVTRFTADVETDTTKLPVKVKLFDVKDIVCILCDTYGSEFTEPKTTKLPKASEIKAHMEAIQQFKTSSTQTIFTDDDIYEIKEYLERYWEKQKGFLEELEEVGFWHFLADNIQFVMQGNWVRTIEILWNKHQPISEVFNNILLSLVSLKFNKVVRVTFEAIVRSSGKSIINVNTLLQHFFTDDTSFKVQLEDGQEINLGAGKLCMLSSEITLSVAQGTIDNRSFINHIDIIDFPGARSRFELSELSEENLSNMLVRGKVAYLFNNYSTNFKTNTLAYCVKTVKTDVPQMPSLIEQWIHFNLGENPQNRTNNLEGLTAPPLFVIFTWWNTQFFKERATNDNPTERVEAQFKTLVSQEIMTDKKWPHEWVIKNGSTVKFRNYYLLRDFERSVGTFKQTNLIENSEGMYDSSGKLALYDTEAGKMFFTDEQQQKYHKDYYEKFIEFHKGKDGLFENPETNFLESSIPGKDGSELIIKNLIPVASNTVSVPIYINVLNNALSKMQEVFDKHYHNDSKDGQIKKAAKDGSELQVKMDIIFGDNVYYFGKFIETLMVSEGEIFELYHQILQSDIFTQKKNIKMYILIRAANPPFYQDESETLDNPDIYRKNLEILAKTYNRDSIEETEKYFTDTEKIDLKELFYGNLYDLQNNSLILAEKAQEYWFESKLTLNNFLFFIEKGFEKGTLEKLFDNLKISFRKAKVTNIIADDIRQLTDGIKQINEAEEMIAHITAGRINEFVNSVGWSYYSTVEKENIIKANKENNLDLKIPDDQQVFQSLKKTRDEGGDKSVEILLDYLEKNLNEELSQKGNKDAEVLQYVPMIKNYRRWIMLMRISFIANCNIPTYNVEANKQLGVLLEKFKKYYFSIH